MMAAAHTHANAVPGFKLSSLLAGWAEVDTGAERSVTGLSLDSRSTRPGDLFLAYAGTHAHGRNYIDAAIAAGAVAVAWEHDPLFTTLPPRAEGASNVPLFAIEGLRAKIGLIADRFYQHPSRDLYVVGVTGTNGKTSVSHFLAQGLSNTVRSEELGVRGTATPVRSEELGEKSNTSLLTPHPSLAEGAVGVIGTLGSGLYGQLQAGSHTTPDAVRLHALLDELRRAGARQVVMEASSHGLEQGRVNGVAFDMAIFTNLSRDHLDYHGTMAAYADAKRRLFETPGLRYAVINADDEFGRELLNTLPAGVRALSYGFATSTIPHIPHLQGTRLQFAKSLELDIVAPDGAQAHLHSPLLGRFNAANLLAALGALLLMEVPLAQAVERLARTQTLPGRMECFGGGAGQPLVVVDYAHTPDALDQVLRALREHLPRGARLWCVFGCGGERDRGKRALMGAAAEELADYAVITDDNPRREDPLAIITDILSGMTNPDGVYIQRVRAQAIAFAITYARPGDVVLVAGKGHEEYQQIGEQRQPFSDRQQVAELLSRSAR